jgi:hypothetical protein
MLPGHYFGWKQGSRGVAGFWLFGAGLSVLHANGSVDTRLQKNQSK